jgi:asparagine synthase (glutamine-hydrolysing)
MSVIFGICATERDTVCEEQLLSIGHAMERWAPDGTFVRASGRIGMGFQPYYTHQRSYLESQPITDCLGNMVTIDGRIDNHEELCQLLEIQESASSDSTIILAAFRRWGEDCFWRFIGDWAIVIWSPVDHILYLARDHAGTRTVYFNHESGRILWSTYLEGFFTKKSSRPLDERYVVSYLTHRSSLDLTPYQGIRVVLPAHYYIIKNDDIVPRQYWRPVTNQRMYFASDADYDAHFILLLKKSITRRTGPGAPIVAQLSGGVDSTSIVCLSDAIRRGDSPDASILDTISFYDDSEPHWNEREYFTKVEGKRGKTGIHIPISYMDRSFEPLSYPSYLQMFPGTDSSVLEHQQRCDLPLSAKGYKAILSGIGGDELLGGVPNPTPELADYLVSGHFLTLLKRSIAWSLDRRLPVVETLRDAATFTYKIYRKAPLVKPVIPPWLHPRIRASYPDSIRVSGANSSRFGRFPSAIFTELSWLATVETLPHLCPETFFRREYRYPYLDRDLVDFLCSVPREQLVSPGRRRLMMRRALSGVVPAEILERRRKAYISHGPIATMRRNRKALETVLHNLLLAEFQIVEFESFHSALSNLLDGNDSTQWPGLMRAIALELWLKTEAKTSTPVMNS